MKAVFIPALLILFALPAAPACAQRDATSAAASDAYRTIIAGSTTALEANGADAEARRSLVRALMETGQYEQAEQIADAGGAAFAKLRGDALLARGKRADAETAYRAALAAHAPDSATARLEIALLQYGRGQRAEAVRELEWFIPFYNNAPALKADELVAIGRAVSALGVTDPQLFHDAVKAYEQAVQADRTSIDARVAEAALFLDKFDSRQAGEIIRDALAVEPGNPRVLLQQARATKFDGSDEALVIVDRALEVNPRLVPALVFRADLLAGQEDYRGAREYLDRAFAIDSTNQDAIALHGAVAWLARDTRTYDNARARANSLYSGSAVFLTKVA
ncbi:MAG TPA: tetratricopeptide repeat protein, partial [Longimicrobiales bacterium]